MAKILLTGFEAYGRTPHNPAESVARVLDGRRVGGAAVVSRIVPNNFFECVEAVRDAIGEIGPDLVVMMGEFPGRAMITVERIAQNLNDSSRYGLGDNNGLELNGRLTAPDGPVAYYSTLPIRAMVKAVREAGIPADISDTAGTFCCNHLMYGILHYVQSNGLPIRAGWIHLPSLPGVAALPDNLGTPSMSAETAAAGVEAALRAALEHPRDIDQVMPSRLQI